ncbi:MAG: helix-turn-helix domain-containing protein [Candidatus Cloacimonetes bacterium]|nr:helix-turn-helix domain-containing protein [Candidatus Cloacimonadota bacterium]
MDLKFITGEDLFNALNLLGSKIDKLDNKIQSLSAGEADQNELLTIHQAAALLKLAPQTIYQKVSRRELKFHKPAGSKRVYFYRQDLLDYIKIGRQKTLKEYEETATDCLINKNK